MSYLLDDVDDVDDDDDDEDGDEEDDDNLYIIIIIILCGCLFSPYKNKIILIDKDSNHYN